ncbi:hypothetical protein LSUE1_G001276 [Lachnellula suecica]|uniref:Peptidase A1 domain-containing protein n=1 Tax=Lachnellula suecica TaxID=602035 RepID=A0A8T9CF53_9HELO|nr:hypothetical protein LSUE1_G001276 [Lachnellula suecica]
MYLRYLHFLSLLSLLPFASPGTATLPPIHYTISRRGGSFPTTDTANLTYLLEQLQIIETRFTATTRDFNGNQVVRKPNRQHGTQANTILLGDVGREGNWFASLQIGDPAQNVDMDLDMLTADWFVFSTGSGKGSYFLDFNSKSYGRDPVVPVLLALANRVIVDSESPLLFPTCRAPTDIFYIPTIKRSIPLSFAHCRPAKQWLRSLLPSGAYLGLAPSTSLSQLKTPSLMQQLMEKEILDTPFWSLVLLNREQGLFSMGGTSIAAVKQVERDVEDALSFLDDHENAKRDSEINTQAPIVLDASNDWNWVQVQGSDGWWQILMRGVWIDGVKALQNQPAILDVNTPFILAPPMAARSFYSSISGSRPLPPPYDQFHTYPCLSPPEIHFEFAGWNVKVLKGRRDKGSSSPGGRFSLGRMESGSGYCIGTIVESRLGVAGAVNEKEPSSGFSNMNGLADVWIIGEPFFRDVQVAFDWKAKKVGMQKV